MKPDCYKCKHRGEVPGSAHSRCNHPEAKQQMEAMGPMAELIGLLGKRGPGLPLVSSLGIKADAHGIKNGWFVWPANFDPVWLEACNGFDSKREK